MTIREVSEKYHISQDTLRYYERIGLIPAVHRTAGGVRDYQETDLGWVEHAICMRSAGVSVEALIEYVRLYQQGDATIEARLHLLQEQEQLLQAQHQQIDSRETLFNAIVSTSSVRKNLLKPSIFIMTF